MSKDRTLQTVANEQRDALNTKVNGTLGTICDAIAEAKPNPVLPEAVFVEYFLDYLKNPAAQPESTLMSKWIELAGGPYNEVNIIDGSGNVLYAVPGIFAAPNIDYGSLGNYNFSEIAANYNLKKKLTAAQATNYLGSILGGMDSSLHVNAQGIIMRWANIFSRYDTVEPATQQAPVANRRPKRRAQEDVSVLDI